MKKRAILLIILSLILFSLRVSTPVKCSEMPENHFIINGLVVSNIPSRDLFSKNRNAQIGLEKVKNAYDLSGEEFFDNSNAIPLFAKVNLLERKFTAEKPLTIFDIRKQYSSFPENDYFQRERIIGTISSAIYKNGVPLSFSEKAEPEIDVTYKEVSTSKGTSYIPVRHVVPTKKVTTTFLLNPFSKPFNERLNSFDTSETYDIDPCFTDTVANRKKNAMPSLDFTGFYVDVPEKLVQNEFLETAQKSLDKFRQYLRKKGKLLIVENLNENNLELGKYGDIIGISYNGNNEAFLAKVRKTFPDKLIFATIDANFSDTNITKIMQQLSLFGIYPEFGHDSSSGDFLYYESKFSGNIGIINKYLNIIILENGFNFKSSENNGKFEISRFDSNNRSLVVIRGNGIYDLKISSGDRHPTDITDLSGNKVKFSENNGTVSVPVKVDGINTVFVNYGSSSVYLLGMVPPVSKNSVTFLVKNFSPANENAKITAKNGKRTIFNSNSSFLPLSLHSLYIKFTGTPISVTVNDKTDSFYRLQVKNFSLLILLFIALLLLLLLASIKKFRVKKLLNVKWFLISIFVLPVSLALVNSYFIHYSLHTITYFIFALMFLILAFYDSEFYFQSITASIIMFFSGLLFNFFEYSTLMPHFFNSILPFMRYNIVLFEIPFLYTLLFFGMYGNKKLNKLEIIVLMFGILGPTVLFKQVTSPFILSLTIKSAYPILITIAAGGLIAALHKKGSGAYLFLFAILLLFLFGALKLSSIFYGSSVLNADNILPTLFFKDFILFSLPLYFLLLLHHNLVKTNPSVSVNTVIKILFAIISITTFASQWAIKFKGNTIIDQMLVVPSYVIVAFLLLLILMEPINKKY